MIGYHALDYNLLYFNVRANVKERIAQFLLVNEETAPLPIASQ